MMQPAEGAAVSESAKGLIFRLEREINFRFLLKMYDIDFLVSKDCSILEL